MSAYHGGALHVADPVLSKRADSQLHVCVRRYSAAFDPIDIQKVAAEWDVVKKPPTVALTKRAQAWI